MIKRLCTQDAPPRLFINYGLCVGGLQFLLRSLSKQPERLSLYDEIIQQQLKADIIESTPLRPTDIIPHQTIWNEQMRKLRIVYDASAGADAETRCERQSIKRTCISSRPRWSTSSLTSDSAALVAHVEKAFSQGAKFNRRRCR
uniref:Uncharacterized protein n=1 Tax=Parascaris equorum TaxID=6256 RepID=A0A914RHL4_PAREQ